MHRKGLPIPQGHDVDPAEKVFANVCTRNPSLHDLGDPSIISEFLEGALRWGHIPNSLLHPQQYLRKGFLSIRPAQFLHFIH